MYYFKYKKEVIISVSPEVKNLVEVGDETKVAHCWLDIRQSDAIWITELYVPEEDRRNGFARKLMQSAIKYARDEGFKTIRLKASDCFGTELNILSKFYESFGFRPYNLVTEQVQVERIGCSSMILVI